MEVDRANPAPDARPASAGKDTCAWCVQLEGADANTHQALGVEGKTVARALAGAAGAAPVSRASRLATAARTVLVGLAVVTIAAAAVSVVLTE